MPGTRVDAEVVRVVDGDTLRVKAGETEESLRILALDTEESSASSNKPETPWGHRAKDEAISFFQPGETVTLEFPGNETPEICWQKYRGNFGRPLVFVYKRDGLDFQEHMIQKGFSPYFVKYGYAVFSENHELYTHAEREAQKAHIGVWNQLVVNGSEARNYAALGVWWSLRAKIIEEYRAFKQANPSASVFNTRLDYERLVELAEDEEEATVFTELRDPQRVGGNHVIIGVGSLQQPFQVFIPNVDEEPGQSIMNLLKNRYISSDIEHPRRSYTYITGPLKIFGGRPEVVVTQTQQIQDKL